jgi:hypothetical protein
MYLYNIVNNGVVYMSSDGVEVFNPERRYDTRGSWPSKGVEMRTKLRVNITLAARIRLYLAWIKCNRRTCCNLLAKLGVRMGELL